MSQLAYVMMVYEGSNGEATKALYARLEQYGPAGVIALNLFRASKCSARAKVYRGGVPGKGSFRGMAYDRKQWSIGNLVKVLAEHSATCGLAWGWGVDNTQPYHRHVLYVELPSGQVSFHTEHRGEGPDAPQPWDGQRGFSAHRICAWTAQLLERRAA